MAEKVDNGLKMINWLKATDIDFKDMKWIRMEEVDILCDWLINESSNGFINTYTQMVLYIVETSQYIRNGW